LFEAIRNLNFKLVSLTIYIAQSRLKKGLKLSAMHNNCKETPSLQFKYTFKDYPKLLFTQDGIDLVIYYGSSISEMKFTPHLVFDPANIGDTLYSVELSAFLATEFSRIYKKRATHFPRAFLSLNVEYNVPDVREISATSIENGTLDCTKVKGDFRDHNILLVGSGNVNPLTALVLKAYEGQLPVYFDKPTSKAKIISKISGKFYSREREGWYAALLCMLPNPWNQKKVAILAVGTTRWGTQAAMMALINSDIPNNKYDPNIPAKVVSAKTKVIGSYEHTIGYEFLE